MGAKVEGGGTRVGFRKVLCSSSLMSVMMGLSSPTLTSLSYASAKQSSHVDKGDKDATAGNGKDSRRPRPGLPSRAVACAAPRYCSSATASNRKPVKEGGSM